MHVPGRVAGERRQAHIQYLQEAQELSRQEEDKEHGSMECAWKDSVYGRLEK